MTLSSLDRPKRSLLCLVQKVIVAPCARRAFGITLDVAKETDHVTSFSFGMSDTIHISRTHAFGRRLWMSKAAAYIVPIAHRFSPRGGTARKSDANLDEWTGSLGGSL
jgi:hypothetical protein